MQADCWLYKYLTHIITTCSWGQWMSSLIMVRLKFHLSALVFVTGWSRTGSSDYYSTCMLVCLSLVCWWCATDSYAFRISDDTMLTANIQTSILPSPFMALCRTSASALALKFPLAFTVPLLACNTGCRRFISWCTSFCTYTVNLEVVRSPTN